jgi:aryl-alcohol dehydrogenase-like predicted oxidoreductase
LLEDFLGYDMRNAHGSNVATVALAYVLAKPFVTSVAIGANRIDQLDQALYRAVESRPVMAAGLDDAGMRRARNQEPG